MRDAHYLGEFATLTEVWDLYPHGGCPGDYVVVGRQKVVWNDDRRVWGEAGDDVSSVETQHVEGNLIVDGDLTVGGTTKGEEASFTKLKVESLDVENPPYAGKNHNHDKTYAKKIHKHDVSDIKGFDGGDVVLPGTIENAKHADIAYDLDEDSPVYEKVLRSDRADSTSHLLSLLGGANFGHFTPGFLGSGANINENGDGEVRSLKVHGALEVNEYRFNRIDVISGETWNTFAFGKFTSVDTETQIATVDLVEGELLTSHVNDINRGIFHNLAGGNSTDDGKDECGFHKVFGYTTSYFTPIELLPDGKSFRYALKPGTTAHPCAEMKFAAYGNFTDKSRRSSSYETRTTEILLAYVNTWQIDPDRHYMFVKGLLDGITIGGMELHGYSTLQRNSYMMGGQILFTPQQLEEMKGNDAYSVSLSTYEGVIVVDSAGNIIDSMQQEHNVVSGDSNVVSGGSNVIASRNKLAPRIQAFRGKNELRYNTVMAEDSYVVQVYARGVECELVGGVLIITQVTDIANAYADLEVNCEGVALFTKHYQITAVLDGDSVWSTYHDGEEMPSTPAGDGAQGGWHRELTSTSVWVSQKNTRLITDGYWGTPVRLKGIDGNNGINGANGVNGKDGVSIVFQGSFATHPVNPQNGWSYYNTTDKKSYVYQSEAWYQMTVDGVAGANGSDGLSVDYKGDLKDAPANPQKNWCYRDTDNGCVYLYNGSAWVLMVADGSNGTDGANGSNGLSVFITYNDSVSQPATPIGNGTLGGWHTAPNADCVWMSQKVATDASFGSWGSPIRIKGKDGTNGTNGVDANLLPWVEQWNNNKTLIDGEYVVSPKMFSGTRSADGKLTGIAQGRDCITIGGVKRTGIFALVDDKVVFSLDPMTGEYSFEGKVNATSGTFNNIEGSNIKISGKSEFTGILKGATGTFRTLTCIDNDGKTLGEITFGTDGRLWFSGDIIHQGYDYEKERGFRFLTSDLWCRGGFGSANCCTLQVIGRTGKYLVNGNLLADIGEAVTVTYESKRTSGIGSYFYSTIPLAGYSGAEGFHVDLVLIDSANDTYYELSGDIGKKVTVVNTRSGSNSISIICNGDKKKLAGGTSADFINIGSHLMNPAPSTSAVGRGWLAGSLTTNSWN